MKFLSLYIVKELCNNLRKLVVGFDNEEIQGVFAIVVVGKNESELPT